MGNTNMFDDINRLLVIAAFALLLAGCGSNEQPGRVSGNENKTGSKPPSVAPAHLVLRGGKIVTVDDAIGIVEAIAIRAHEIQAVGSNEDIARYVSAATRVIELNGKMAMPGFIEGHGHFMSLGRARQILDLNDAANWEEIVGKVAQAVDTAEAGEWIFGRGIFLYS